MLRQSREILTPDIETQLNDLVEATNGLIDQVNASKSVLNTKSEEAKGYSDSADTALVEIDKANVEVEKALEEALAAKDDTVSLSDNAAISLTAGASKVPLADSEGFIDYKYIKPVRVSPADFSLPLRRDLYLEEGVATPVKIDVSQAQDGSTLATVPNLYQAEFTRNSEATYMDRGVLKTAGINEPRFETDINGNPLGILIEGASTNICPKSSDLMDSYWFNEGSGSDTWIIKSQDSTVSPDGKSLATKIEITDTGAVNQTGRLRASFPNMKSGLVSYSVFVKAGSYDCGQIYFWSPSPNKPLSVRFRDLNTKPTLRNLENVTSSEIEEFNNGWFRIKVSGEIDAGNYTAMLYVNNEDLSNDVIVTGNSLYYFGFQLEEKPFATSYIPTNGSIKNRQADIVEYKVDIEREHAISFKILGDSLKNVTGGALTFLTTNGLGGLPKFDANINSTIAYAPPNIKGGQYYLSKRDLDYTKEMSIVGTSTKNLAKLFIDGTQVSSSRVDLGYGNDLKSRIASSGQVQVFHIKDFKIWNRALTDEQIYFLGKN